MKVILLEEVRGKGGEGDVINVADGFANNCLLPKGMAVKATPGNLKQLELRRKNIAKREEVRIADAENLKTQLEDSIIIVTAKVGEEGQLFGSVTAQMIADAVQQQKDVEVDRRRIDIHTPIKTAGDHEVELSIYRDIKAGLKIRVVDAEGLNNLVDAAVEAAEAAEPVSADKVEEIAQLEEISEALEDAADTLEAAEIGAESEADAEIAAEGVAN